MKIFLIIKEQEIQRNQRKANDKNNKELYLSFNFVLIRTININSIYLEYFIKLRNIIVILKLNIYIMFIILK